MNARPVIIQQADLEWESWSEEEKATRGNVLWKTLLSRDRTDSRDLTVGIARLAPGEKLARHRHAPAEIYYILKGAGLIYLDGVELMIETGTAWFIPGNAVHGISNPGTQEVEWLYVFPTDSFGEVIYHFDVE